MLFFEKVQIEGSTFATETTRLFQCPTCPTLLHIQIEIAYSLCISRYQQAFMFGVTTGGYRRSPRRKCKKCCRSPLQAKKILF